MKDSIRESKYKVGDTVNILYYKNMTEREMWPEVFEITEVIYDLEKHSPDTHMYAAKNENKFGLWFESELVLTCLGVE